MNKLYFSFLFYPFFCLSQTQVGSDIYGEALGDYSGHSVSLSANAKVMAVGAPNNDEHGISSGQVRVYQNTSGVWMQIGSDINGESAYDFSGSSVSLSSDGTVVAIGASSNDGNGDLSGHVRVYKNVSGVWIQQGSDIDGDTPGDISGFSVSLSHDGNIVAIGSPFSDENGNIAGAVKVYKNTGGVWTQIGSKINGVSSDDYSGTCVSLSSDGSTVAIGSQYSNSNGLDSGSVRVFKNISGDWVQVGSEIKGQSAFDYSGASISLSSDGTVVAIGSVNDNSNGIVNSGIARVFKNVSGAWVQVGSNIGGEVFEISGMSVSLSSDGSVLAIGTVSNGSGEVTSGRVKVYKNVFGVWQLIIANLTGEVTSDFFGYSVSLCSDGSKLAVGAPYNINNVINSDTGYVRVFDLTPMLSSDDFSILNFSVYPNPAIDRLSIQLSDDIELQKVNLFDMLGQLIKTENSRYIDLSGLETGNYFIEVYTNKGKAIKKVIIK